MWLALLVLEGRGVGKLTVSMITLLFISLSDLQTAPEVYHFISAVSASTGIALRTVDR